MKASGTAVRRRALAAFSASWNNPSLSLLIIMTMGLGLRVFNVGTASLWNDELFTRFYPDLGVAYMWTEGFSLETTPPAYYTIMAGWSYLFGISPGALRWPSVIFSTMAIPIVNTLGRDLGGPTRGLVAALIFALAPMEVYFAQEARAYALMLLPVGLAMIGVARFLSSPMSLEAAIFYVVGIVMATYVHNVSAFIAAASGIVITIDFLIRGNLDFISRRQAILRWFSINALAGLLCIPEFLAMVSEVKTDQLHWMRPMMLWDIRSSVSMFVAGPATTPLLLGSALACALGIVGFAAFCHIQLERRLVTVLIAIPALVFALMVAAGLRVPFLVPRLLCWMWIPLSVLMAVGLLHHGRMRPYLVVVTVVVFVIGLAFQLRPGATAKEPWDVFLSRIAPLTEKADLLVTGPWTQPMALKYHGYPMTNVRHWDLGFPPTAESVAIRDLLGVREISRDELIAEIRAGKRILLIQRIVDFQWRRELTQVQAPGVEILQQCGEGSCLGAFYWDARREEHQR